LCLLTVLKLESIALRSPGLRWLRLIFSSTIFWYAPSPGIHLSGVSDNNRGRFHHVTPSSLYNTMFGKKTIEEHCKRGLKEAEYSKMESGYGECALSCPKPTSQRATTKQKMSDFTLDLIRTCVLSSGHNRHHIADRLTPHSLNR